VAFLWRVYSKSIVATPKVRLPKMPLEKSDPSSARKGERPANWRRRTIPCDRIFTHESLRPGNVVEGPR